MKISFRYSLFFLIFFLIFSIKVSASDSCLQEAFSQKTHVNSENLTEFLNCVSKLKSLTKLGAQWIFLRKAHWVIIDSSENWQVSISANPVLPESENIISLNPIKWKTEPKSLQKLIDKLQNDIFPQAILGFSQGVENNISALSYQATMYQLISFMDTPLKYWKKHESASTHYLGTLIESHDFPKNWWEEQVTNFPYLKWIINKDKYWSEIRTQLKNEFSSCPTACFVRQERKILSALLISLEHPEFVKKVHLNTLNGFGPQQGDIAKKQENMPRNYGCYADQSYKDSPSGLRSYDFNWTGDSWRPNYIEMGKWALIGRALYIEAINKTQINPSVRRVPTEHNGRSFNDAPAHYSGQNAIIRSISDRAVESLMNLGGLGGSKEIENMDGRVVQATGTKATEAIDLYLKNASYYFADYQRKKYLKQSVKNHPVTTEAFFTETIISKGYNLKTWADILSKLNPPVFYHIFAYDYEFMPRPGVPWKSYYDRVAYVLENEFEQTIINTL
ncbi:MAG: hypothetical protein KDD58_09245 [Bdellovibrionales bacterium]|nr:hypothetical protein [Bdellovibrionales bacterium]